MPFGDALFAVALFESIDSAGRCRLIALTPSRQTRQTPPKPAIFDRRGADPITA
jgi:hypothetical protein